jgi:hypothetical protein
MSFQTFLYHGRILLNIHKIFFAADLTGQPDGICVSKKTGKRAA